VAGSCEHGNEPSGSIKCGEFLGLAERTLSFLRRTLLHGVIFLLKFKGPVDSSGLAASRESKHSFKVEPGDLLAARTRSRVCMGFTGGHLRE
jgi:hypothetical protein